MLLERNSTKQRGDISMNISFESKGDLDNLSKWLNSVTNSNPTNALKQIAREGEASLAGHTPRDTGQTAGGWTSEIVTKGDMSEVVWTNTAHSDLNVNLAKLIELGHGTGTGGYVPPRPYIKNAMGPVWADAGDKVFKELIK